MVCLGNICRSPLADGLLRKKVALHQLDVIVDSAGTSGFHSGQKPDLRMIDTAKKFECDLSILRARQFVKEDYKAFDKIYVMDSNNLKDVLKLAPNEQDKAKVDLLMNLVYPGQNIPVPDPYYGGGEGFLEVYAMVDKATDKIIEAIQKK